MAGLLSLCEWATPFAITNKSVLSSLEFTLAVAVPQKCAVLPHGADLLASQLQRPRSNRFGASSVHLQQLWLTGWYICQVLGVRQIYPEQLTKAMMCECIFQQVATTLQNICKQINPSLA